MDIYRNALIEMRDLLDFVGVKYWAAYVDEDIKDWDSNKAVGHHLAAYHKDGLGEVWICKQNGFNIDTLFEPWATYLHSTLCDFCVYIGRKVNEGEKSSSISVDEVIQYREMVLSKYPCEYDMSGLICRECGNTEIREIDIEFCLAKKNCLYVIGDILKNGYIKSFEFNNIFNRPEIIMQREKIKQEIQNNNYNLIYHGDNVRACRECQSNNNRLIKFKTFSNGSVMLERMQ